MSKRRYNWKARQIVTTLIDNSKTHKIELELGNNKTNYDECNALVLPSQKRETKIKHEQQTNNARILSRKQRKRLEKIVERKQKKENRANLLEALSKVQATPEELTQLTSIASVQTKGLKKLFQEQNQPERTKRKLNAIESDVKINSVHGSKKWKRMNLMREEEDEERWNKNDPNVVGFESSSDEEEEQEVREVIEERGVNEEEKEDKMEIVEKNVEDIKIEKTPPVRKPAIFIPVDRTPEMEKSRLKLPILAEEQQIMETINENPIILIAGETGSGKTTQIPQFLYESGYAQTHCVAVTEPRRVAAIAMSKRVGDEMNLCERVSYLIRFEGNVTDETRIKFMTDGVLLKEIQSDFLLRKYSVVILDEAHERSIYTDILVGLLSRIVLLRNKKGMPFKLIIMSATLRLEDFTDNTRLFKTSPPVLKVEARQFPVTIHFNKRTPDDYIKEAYHKVVKIHTKLPDGAILVFVTGQQEVVRLVRRLRKSFPYKSTLLKLAKRKRRRNRKLPEINLNDYSLPGGRDIDDYDHDDDIENDVDDDDSDLESIPTNCEPLWTLPLYSLLSNDKQQRVFESAPDGCRLCVVATNVAETSLTIPNVRYVVDTGKAKVKLYDKITGVNNYQVMWTSKASANQRAGRAGRTGPGHCYRLYSSAVFNDTFPEFSIPEIQQKPVDDLYLQMKCMNIDKVVNFPFPTAPDLMQLKTAENRLEILGALHNGKVSALGKMIAKFPVLPRFGKMLALSHQYDLLPYTICLVAALSVQEVLLETPIGFMDEDVVKQTRNKWRVLRRQWAGVADSLLLGDAMVLLKAVGAAEFAHVKLEEFCQENGLRLKAVLEIRKLRMQLTNEIKLNVENCDLIVDPKLEPPNEIQTRLLRQLLLSGLGDQVAKRIDPDELKETEDKIKYKYAYHCMDLEDPVFIHSGSVLRHSRPEYVIYQEIYETNKLYMRGVTAIQPEWLPIYVPKLCQLSQPLLNPEPRYDPGEDQIFCTVTSTFGRQCWTLPPVEIPFPGNNLDRYKWFARFLLDGRVCKKLAVYTSSLLSTPSTMVKSWAKLQPRTEAILKVLVAYEVCRRERLEEIWTKQPQFLLNEYQKWLPESAHNDIALNWPPL